MRVLVKTSFFSRWGVTGRALPALGLVSLMVMGVVASRVSPDAMTSTVYELVHGLRGTGPTGAAIFAGSVAVIALSGIFPMSAVAVAAGAIFGLLIGFVLSALSAMAGAVIAFFLSRSALRPIVEDLTAGWQRLRDFDSQIGRNGWELVCLLRISPIMPFSATSFMLGLSSISLRDYCIGTLASLPAMFGYVLIGVLADAGLTSWERGAGQLQWILLGIGGLAVAATTVRLSQLAIRIGFLSGTTFPPDSDHSPGGRLP